MNKEASLKIELRLKNKQSIYTPLNTASKSVKIKNQLKKIHQCNFKAKIQKLSDCSSEL